MGTSSLEFVIKSTSGNIKSVEHLYTLRLCFNDLWPFSNSFLVQLKHVVNQLHQMSKSNRLPLVILHRSRVFGGPAQYPNNKKLLESWRNAGALYATPPGSNDDW
mgnify:CR=1 FL=1